MRTALALISALCLLAAAPMQARDPQYIVKNSEGKEFWVCFMKNFRDAAKGSANPDRVRLQLFLTSSYDAKARIEIDGIDYDSTVRIRANTVVSVTLPSSVLLKKTETAERLAVHVTSDTLIGVYGLNTRFQTTDTYLGLPTTVLGTEYRAMGYTKLSTELLSALTVIATEDDTEVTITPTATTQTRRKIGKPFSVTLRKGDAYTVGAIFESIGQCDLTGTLIKSNKKIAVFSGHSCAYVPPKVDACNHLVEQMPPVSSWGKHFYLGNLRERSKYTYRVVASQDDTRVFEDSKLVAVLRAGEYHENPNVSRHLQVTADKPVMVAQFAQGFKNRDSVGDPMMILVSPTQQFLKQYRFATPINGDWHHYVNVVAPTTSISQIRLNGRRIDSNQFAILGESRYSIAQVAIPFGTHVITSETPFGLYSYGFGFRSDAYDAYGNMAGQAFLELDKMIDSLAPMAEGIPARDAYVVTFRDDRPMDRGIKAIKVLATTTLDATIPRVEPGVPQIAVRVSPSAPGAGRIVFKVTDAADNVADYTVCYVFDPRIERFTYIVNPGSDVLCAAEQSWFAGAFGSVTHTYHTPGAGAIGAIQASGDFGPTQGTAGWGGLLLGRRFSHGLSLVGRIGLSSAAGSLLAPDRAVSAVYDTSSNTYLPYQEGTEFRRTAPYLDVSAIAEWFPERNVYLLGGLQASFSMGSGVEVERRILRPSHFTYGPGLTNRLATSTTELSTFNPVLIGLVGGIGATYPVSFRASVFAEATYTHMLNSVVSDADWRMQVLRANVGVRYRW